MLSRKESTQQVLDFLKNNPGKSIYEIAEKAEASKTNIAYILVDLQKIGKVYPEKRDEPNRKLVTFEYSLVSKKKSLIP